MKEKQEKKGFIQTGAVFPNNARLSSVNYSIELGSFDVPMRKLLDYALNCMQAMKELEKNG